MKLSKVLAEKMARGRKLLTILPYGITTRQAAEIMCEKKVGCALVAFNREINDNSETYSGIISERDLILSLARGENPDEVKIENIMTRNIIVAQMDDDVDILIKIMGQEHIRHLPVIGEKSQIVGLLSVRDLLISMSEEKDLRISHLNDLTGCCNKNQVY